MNRVVNRSDENFAFLNVVIGMLIGGEGLTAITFVVVVIGLDEGIVGKSAFFAVVEKLRIGGEALGLILKKIDDFHGGAGLIEIVNFRSAAAVEHAVINILVRNIFVEEIHADFSERCAVVREGAIADGGTGNGGKPPVEYGEVCRESR